MAASLAIEDETGTHTSRVRHPHNGYYAGDFFRASRPAAAPNTFDRPRFAHQQ